MKRHAGAKSMPASDRCSLQAYLIVRLSTVQCVIPSLPAVHVVNGDDGVAGSGDKWPSPRSLF
jgi:hypothetical protein